MLFWQRPPGLFQYRKGIFQQMPLNEYVQSGGKYLRCGYTTGTCAALAAAAAARLLFTGHAPERISLITPKGIRVDTVPEICGYVSGTGAPDHIAATASVRKDAGDDKDVTDGILICATVTVESGLTTGNRYSEKIFSKDKNPDGYVSAEEPEIRIDGGNGVGRVTKPGLDQPVGNAAINRVPRKMIAEAVGDVCRMAGYSGRAEVVISVPDGERIAKKTFNQHLGIEGGISILGTSGIVEPMSMQAFIDAVCVEIRQVRQMNDTGRLILTPGNYGMDFLRGLYSSAGEIKIAEVPIVMCSNFIGDALDAASAEGFREVLLVGHIGKLVKLSGGVMNTHSRYADCRMELFAAHAAVCGAGTDVCRRLMECVTADACLDVLYETGFLDAVMKALLTSMEKYLVRRIDGAYEVGAVTFSNVHGFLGCTRGADRLFDKWTAP